MQNTPKLTLLASALALAAVLSACGGGGSSSPPVQVVTTNATLAANPTSVPALANTPLGFTNGVPAFGTTAETTLLFTSTSTSPGFSIASGGATATGATTFGSCIFTVGASTFPASSPLGMGRTVTVNPCSIAANTAGSPANGAPALRNITLQLGAVSSRAASITITVSPTGSIAINGVTAGTVTLANATGT